MNLFEEYAKRANTIVSQPPKLLGVNKTRGEARIRYDALVEELRACATKASLAEELEIRRAEIAQFHAELEFYWEGDGDFLGLRKEIELAQARVDDGLDLPRWDFGPTSSPDSELYSQVGQGPNHE